MEALQQALAKYRRFLELEDLIPVWEAQRIGLRGKIRETKLDRDWKQIDLCNLENPNFFQRLLGKVEEKKEKAYREYREASAAYDAACRELDAMEEQLRAGKQEMEELTGSRDAYLQEKDGYCGDMQALVLMEAAALSAVAIAAADRTLAALEEARIWMREDARYKGVRSVNRKLEFLAEAQKNALRLREIAEQLPEGYVTIGTYLQYPSAYIVGVTSEFKQLDRVNAAMVQVRSCRDELKALREKAEE